MTGKTTFFPAFGDNSAENLINFVVNTNPLTFSVRAGLLLFPELAIPLSQLNDQFLTAVQPPDNFLDLNRKSRVPLRTGDRVKSPNRIAPGGQLFGGYILVLYPLNIGAIVIWDGGPITYDPLSDLEPQSLRQ